MASSTIRCRLMAATISLYNCTPMRRRHAVWITVAQCSSLYDASSALSSAQRYGSQPPVDVHLSHLTGFQAICSAFEGPKGHIPLAANVHELVVHKGQHAAVGHSACQDPARVPLDLCGCPLASVLVRHVADEDDAAPVRTLLHRHTKRLGWSADFYTLNCYMTVAYMQVIYSGLACRLTTVMAASWSFFKMPASSRPRKPRKTRCTSVMTMGAMVRKRHLIMATLELRAMYLAT